MSAVSVTAKKGAGRPKSSPKELHLRRIGKYFESSQQLLSAHKSSPSSLREKGRGKQPFNNYVKALQESVAMYHSYLGLLALEVDEAGYEMDMSVSLIDSDMEAPWAKLKTHYRDTNDQALSLNKEFAERRLVFASNKEEYNSNYPFIEWCGFWFESELNAAKRVTTQAIMSFDFLAIPFLSLDEALVTQEAKKGRDTFKNKQGVNKKDKLAEMHSKIIRYQNRLRKALAEIGLEPQAFDYVDVTEELNVLSKENGIKLIRAHKLHTQISKMKDELNLALIKSNKVDALKFKLTLAKKKRLPLTKKSNAKGLTAEEEKIVSSLDSEINALKSEIEAVAE